MYRSILIYGGVRALLVYVDGLVDLQQLEIAVMQPLLNTRKDDFNDTDLIATLEDRQSI
ncbi:hypothetical protein D3C85_1930930 [compost metagenome]